MLEVPAGECVVAVDLYFDDSSVGRRRDADRKANRGTERDLRRGCRNGRSRDLTNDERQPVRAARLTRRRAHGSDVVPGSERALGLTLTRSELGTFEGQQ